MAIDHYRKPYLDSGIFIAWVLPRDIGLLADGTQGDRTPISAQVLQLAEDGEYPVVTSYLTMAEVYKKKGHGTPPLTPDQNGKIMKYFENTWITWVTLERIVAEEANRLLVEYQDQKLRPCDAVHLASALRAKCDVLLTWDFPFTQIKHPKIRIEFPQFKPEPQDLFAGLAGGNNA